MFDETLLDRLRWIYPSTARHSEEAKKFLSEIEKRLLVDVDIFSGFSAYHGWQAFGNVSSAVRGVDRTLVELRFLFQQLTSPGANTPFTRIAAVASALSLVLIRAKRFEELLGFAESLLSAYPNTEFAVSALIKACILRGDIERAESLVNQFAEQVANYNDARAFLYWVQALAMHKLAAAKSRLLKEKYPDLLREQGISVMLNVIEALDPTIFDNRQKDTSVVYCLNIADDKGRWRSASAAFGRVGLGLSRIDGVRGDHLPSTARGRLASYNVEGGEIGCYLGHLKAWETAANNGQKGTFIVEDDAQPIFPFSAAAIIDAMPADADVVFVNSRSRPGWSVPTSATRPENYEFMAIDSTSMESYRNTTAIGTDGYLLSNSGARKFVALSQKFRLACSVDWQMFILCFRDLFSNKIFTEKRSEPILSASLSVGGFKGYVMRTPVIQEMDLGYSPRRLMSP